MLKYFTKPTLTISLQDAETIRSIIDNSNAHLSKLRHIFYQLANYTYTSGVINNNQWHIVTTTDICQILDRKDMDIAKRITNELHNRILMHHENIIPNEWYTNINLILNRMDI